VIKEIAHKYKNVQKGIGDIMGGALIETTAKKIRDEAARETALRMLQDRKMTTDKIAIYSGLSVVEVEQLKKESAGVLTV